MLRFALRVLLSATLLAQSLGCSRPVVRELEQQAPDPKHKIVGFVTKQGEEYWFEDDSRPSGRTPRSHATIRNDSLFAVAEGSPIAVGLDDVRSIYVEDKEFDTNASAATVGVIGLLILLSIAWSNSWSSSKR